MAKKNDWVLIHKIILSPNERAPQVPEDTKEVPLEMWVKGYLKDNEAQIGDEVTIITRTKREEIGKLLEVNPTYEHGFGKFIPELLKISEQVREVTFGGDLDE